MQIYGNEHTVRTAMPNPFRLHSIASKALWLSKRCAEVFTALVSQACSCQGSTPGHSIPPHAAGKGHVSEPWPCLNRRLKSAKRAGWPVRSTAECKQQTFRVARASAGGTSGGTRHHHHGLASLALHACASLLGKGTRATAVQALSVLRLRRANGMGHYHVQHGIFAPVTRVIIRAPTACPCLSFLQRLDWCPFPCVAPRPRMDVTYARR